MREHAPSLQAKAMVGVRFDATEVIPGLTEVSNRVTTLWLMGTFGECQMMAQPAATRWLISPVIHQDVVVPRGMIPFPEMAGDGQGPRLVVVGGIPRWSIAPHRQP
jgi:hypothetical protein